MGVFETLRVIEGRPLFLEAHAAEMKRAAQALGLRVDFDPHQAARALPQRSGRWRWITTSTGTETRFTEEGFASTPRLKISVSPLRLGSANWDARFKTLSYLAHAQATMTATTPEVVMLNEHNHVASAARSNIFWRRKNKIYTPAHECGCRCGVVRGFVRSIVTVEEGNFPLQDLKSAEEIFLTNSLRGIVSVTHFDGKKLELKQAKEMRAIYAARISNENY